MTILDENGFEYEVFEGHGKVQIMCHGRGHDIYFDRADAWKLAERIIEVLNASETGKAVTRNVAKDGA